jgi:hypothetical protein
MSTQILWKQGFRSALNADPDPNPAFFLIADPDSRSKVTIAAGRNCRRSISARIIFCLNVYRCFAIQRLLLLVKFFVDSYM